MKPRLSPVCPNPTVAPSYQVTVHPSHIQFSASAADTVLQAALSAGIELPSSCRNGTCRTCISRLAQGSIAYQIEWPGVSAEEKLEGYFLPCVACARSDLTMETPAV
jgi:ferredoxin